MLRTVQEGMQELKNEVRQLRADLQGMKPTRDVDGVQETNETPKQVCEA